jgi:hypothetical protein
VTVVVVVVILKYTGVVVVVVVDAAEVVVTRTADAAGDVVVVVVVAMMTTMTKKARSCSFSFDAVVAVERGPAETDGPGGCERDGDRAARASSSSSCPSCGGSVVDAGAAVGLAVAGDCAVDAAV